VEIGIDRELSAEVVAEASGNPPDLGSEKSKSGIFASVNEQPVAIPLVDLCKSAGADCTSFDPLFRRFELYMVPHSISLIRRSGFAEITTVGLEVEYLTDGQTCSILALYPSSRWTTWGEIGLSGAAEGGASSGSSDWIRVSAGNLSVKAQASGALALRWAEKIVTPEISATGVGGSRCEWQFEKRDEPLFGRDIQAWSLIAAPKRMRRLTHRCRYYFVSRVAFVPSRVESAWAELICDLPPRG
jgi:hypothetical protein